MADGQFPSLVSKDRDVNALANPIFVQLSDGTAAVGVTAGALDVNVASGSLSVTINAEHAEDSAHSSGDTGSFSLAVRNDTLASLVDTDGDYAPFQVNARGALYVELDPTNDVTISDGGNTITVDGTVAATQSGVWDIGTVTTLTGITNDVNIADGGNSITVDGTVAATQSGVWDIGTVTTLTGITNDVNIADGGNSITVDAVQLDIDDLNLTDDAVRVSGNATANSETNPIFVKNVQSVVSGIEVHDYNTAAAVASDTSNTHTYTVTGSTFLLRSIIVSGSGNIKAEIKVGPTASTVTKAVVFLNGREGDTQQITFDHPIEVPVTGTGIVEVVRTNRQGAATDVYSTIIGTTVA